MKQDKIVVLAAIIILLVELVIVPRFGSVVGLSVLR